MRVWKHVPATAAEAFAARAPSASANFWSMADERVSYDGFCPRHAAGCAPSSRKRGEKRRPRGLVMRNLPEWPVVFMGCAAGRRHRRAAQCLVDRQRARLCHPGLRRAAFCSPMAKGWRGSKICRLGHRKIFVTRAANPPAAVTMLEDVIGASGQWGELPDGPMPLTWHCRRKTTPPSSTPPAPRGLPRGRWAPIAR